MKIERKKGNKKCHLKTTLFLISCDIPDVTLESRLVLYADQLENQSPKTYQRAKSDKKIEKKEKKNGQMFPAARFL